VTVGALTIIFIIVEMILIAQRKLLPGIMMLLSFILLVLFLTGAVGTGIQLFGRAAINERCNTYVFNNRQYGPSESTLAFLQQQNICKCDTYFSPGGLLGMFANDGFVGQCWQAVFAFWIIGSVFFIWMMVIASQVNQNQYE
jgi:hypothetical protein